MAGPAAAAGAKAAGTAAGRVSGSAASRSGAAQAAKSGAAGGGGGGKSLTKIPFRRRKREPEEEGGQDQGGSGAAKLAALAGGACLFAMLVILAPLLILEASASGCGGEEDEAVPIQTNHESDPEDLSQTQIAIRIYLTGEVMHMTPRQIVTAYATAYVESNMTNIYGGDATSSGIYQQQNFSPWTDGGRNRNNIIDTTISFFLQLRKYDTGQPVGTLAAEVQRPEEQYEYRYALWVDEATEMYNRIHRLVGTAAGAKTIQSLQGVTIGGGLGGCLLTGSGEYINPFQGQHWTPERTDQGVDFWTAENYPIRAIGDARMMPTGSWEPYGPFAWYKLLDGPQRGHCVFVAEGIQNILPAGTEVKAGEAIARSIPGWQYGIETGWAQGIATPSTPYNGAADGTPMPGGKAFNRFLRSLGAETREHWGPGPLYVGASC